MRSRAIAPNADFRPFQSKARSASSAATRTLTAPLLVAISRTASTCASTPRSRPSTSTSSTACRVAGVAGAHEIFDGGGDAGVHHFECGGEHPAGDDAGHGRRGRVDRVERAQHRRDRGRIGCQSHRHSRRDPHRPFGADEAAPQVVAGHVGCEPAEPDGLTVGEYDVDREHVRGRDARREAVRTAGVRRDVAADRAGLLRRRIRRVVQPEVRDRPSEIEIEQAWLDPGDPGVGVDVEEAVHAGGDDDDGVFERRRAAGEPGAAAPGHERPAVLAGDTTAAATSSADRGQHTATACPSLTPASRAYDREFERLRARTGRTERVAQIDEERVVRSDLGRLPLGSGSSP